MTHSQGDRPRRGAGRNARQSDDLVRSLQGPEPAEEDGDADDDSEAGPIPGQIGAFGGEAFVDRLLVIRGHLLRPPERGQDGADDGDDQDPDSQDIRHRRAGEGSAAPHCPFVGPPVAQAGRRHPRAQDDEG